MIDMIQKLDSMKFIFLIVAIIQIAEWLPRSQSQIRGRLFDWTLRKKQWFFDALSWMVQILLISEVIALVVSVNPSISTFLQPIRRALTIDVSEFVHLPQSLHFVFSLVLFLSLWDLFQYWTHRLLHYGAFYDRLHRFHHSTRMYVLTTFRHHPLELVFINFSITVPTASLYAVVFPSGDFAVVWWLATIQSLLLHSEITLPRIPILSSLILLPNHHRVHHQTDAPKTSNFGQYFTFWDRLFGTYTDPFRQPREVVYTGTDYSILDNFRHLI